MTTQEQTCAERLPDYLKGRLEDFTRIRQAIGAAQDINDDEALEEAESELYAFPLGVSTYTVKRVDLGTGGPGDWLEYMYQEDSQEISRITYHFADWFDHAERVLEGEEFQNAEQFAYDLGLFEA